MHYPLLPELRGRPRPLGGPSHLTSPGHPFDPSSRLVTAPGSEEDPRIWRAPPLGAPCGCGRPLDS
eukprot:5399166-Pyramimonas_sp.AAC.1